MLFFRRFDLVFFIEIGLGHFRRRETRRIEKSGILQFNHETSPRALNHSTAYLTHNRSTPQSKQRTIYLIAEITFIRAEKARELGQSLTPPAKGVSTITPLDWKRLKCDSHEETIRAVLIRVNYRISMICTYWHYCMHNSLLDQTFVNLICARSHQCVIEVSKLGAE